MPRSVKAASAFVWSVWALLLAAALWFVRAYGSRLPYADDWEYIPFLANERSVSLHWLWEQVAQHRYLLNKVVFLGLIEIGRGDFLFLLVCIALAFGAISWAMIRTAAWRRGRVDYTDAFFPLLWLNWGLAEHLLHAGNGVYYGLPSILASLVLLAVVLNGRGVRRGWVLGAGVCLLLLVSSSATGVLYAPALAVCVAMWGVELWRSAEHRSRKSGAIVLTLVALSAIVFGLYFVGLESHGYGAAARPTPLGKLRVSLAVLGSGLGFDSRFWLASGLAVLLLGLASGQAPLREWLRERERWANRGDALGLLLFGAAAGCLILGLGWGRESMGPEGGFLYRVLALPVLCWIYLACVSGRGRIATGVQAALALLLGVSTVINLGEGVEAGRAHAAHVRAFERDLRGGVPVHQLVARHKETILYWGTHDDLAGYLLTARSAAIGAFEDLRLDPPFREVELPTAPSTVSGIGWTEGTANGLDAASCLEFVLPHPMDVAAIRFSATHSNHEAATLRVTVSGGETVDHWLRAWPGYCRVGGPIGGAPEPFTIYVADRISAFRVCPDEVPFRFHVFRLVLLVPEDGASRPPELDAQPAEGDQAQ